MRTSGLITLSLMSSEVDGLSCFDGESSEFLGGCFIISFRKLQKISDFSDADMSFKAEEDENESSSSDRMCVDDSATGDSTTIELTLLGGEGVSEGIVEVTEVGATVVDNSSDMDALPSDGVSFDGVMEISDVEISVSGNEHNRGVDKEMVV